MKVIAQVRENLSLFKNLYDTLRIIDPITKKVIYFEGNQGQEDQYCYCFWGKDTHCNNCVSMRTYLENETFVKLEYKEHRIFFVISTSVLIDDITYVVELIKDISNKGVVKGEDILKLHGAREMIDEMNEKIAKNSEGNRTISNM
jgi:two-component system, cell cycle response regulator